MSERAPVIVLGAGLTGLSAACHLRVPCRVLERSDRVGGLCTTDEERGYRFDRTGHLLHLRDEGIRDWVLSILDEEPLVVERRSRIWSNGVYTRYPFQANTFGLPPVVARECVLGFIEARDAERDAAARGAPLPPPADFEEFILRTMGRGIAERFMVPYNTKLWGVPPRDMSPAWTSRFVPRPTVEEVVSGAVGCNDREVGYNAVFRYPRRGIGELAGALARRVSSIELGRAPRAIDWRSRRLVLEDGEVVGYERLISSIPLDALLRAMDGLPSEVAVAAGRLRCAPLRYLDLALRRPPKHDFHWIYVPEVRYPFYRVGAYSSFSPDLTPAGCGSLYVELASREPPDLERLVPEVADGLVEMGLIDGAGDIAFARARHLSYAYVIYDHHYTPALDVIHPFLREHGIVSCGRYGAWEYSAMEDALLSGRDAARAIEEES
jgi:protoporphyrinogen oxidase